MRSGFACQVRKFHIRLWGNVDVRRNLDRVARRSGNSWGESIEDVLLLFNVTLEHKISVPTLKKRLHSFHCFADWNVSSMTVIRGNTDMRCGLLGYKTLCKQSNTLLLFSLEWFSSCISLSYGLVRVVWHTRVGTLVEWATMSLNNFNHPLFYWLVSIGEGKLWVRRCRRYS